MKLTYEEWSAINENELSCIFAETGRDRELCYNREEEEMYLYEHPSLYPQLIKENEMEIINLTPHDIVVSDGVKTKVYKASGEVARLDIVTHEQYPFDGFMAVTHEVVGNNLPKQTPKVYYIVSAMVLEACGRGHGRVDLLAPNTNDASRNEKGHIVSVPGFVK